ncbi:MAG TPA: trypsin-like peptidase domain-containing protein [Planctomycetota bacterium]|nr:trypsin-like peptidase domain-containing protein [Planctomycetota bacterium]
MRPWQAAVLGATLAVAASRAGLPDAEGEVRAPLDFQSVIDGAKAKVFPAVVFVRPVQEDLSGGEARRVEVFGSGVIVSPDGYVVTNHHVAENAREIQCVLNDRRRVDATIVGLDESTDLALLKLALSPGETVPSASMGTSGDVEEGQFVMAMGAPYGFERSISLGIVSNARRHLGDGEQHAWNNWVQTDAAINPGNSGGPLVDTRGRVVGINTLGVQMASSLGFAIPVDVVKSVVERLRRDGRVVRSHTGLVLRPLVDYTQNTVFDGDTGVIVDDVAPGSPAETAGIRAGDRLLRVGDFVTRGRYREDLPPIRWALADLPAGSPTPFEVLRGKETLTIPVVPDLCDDCDLDGFEAPRWNATFQAITRERTPDLAFHRRTGAYVLGVRFPGNAAQAGLREGDVVISVDREKVDGLGDLATAYAKACLDSRPKRTALVEVLRDGRRSFLAIDFTRADLGER